MPFFREVESAFAPCMRRPHKLRGGGGGGCGGTFCVCKRVPFVLCATDLP